MLIANDLLFLAQGKLMLWDHILEQAIPVIVPEEAGESSGVINSQAVLPGSVLKYSVDERLNEIALFRAKGISANAVELFDLMIYDVNSGEIVTLVDEISRIFQFSISPDAKWVAYTLQEESGPIYAIQSNGEGQPIEIGNYVIEDEWECCEIVWSQDSKYVIWSDARGVWITNPEESHPRRVLPDTLEVTDLGGDKSSIRVMFTSLTWSPTGRFVLSTVKPYRSAVHWQGIIDIRRGHIAEVPDSFEFQSQSASVAWMRDGHLLEVYGNDLERDRSPSLKIWRVVPTRIDLMLLEADSTLTLEQFSDFLPDLRDKSKYSLGLPTQIDKRLVSFVLSSSDEGFQPILFKFDLKFESIIKVGEIPSDTVSVRWSPDGNNAILQGKHGSILVISSDSKGLIDLYSTLGMETCCVTWLYPDQSERLKMPAYD